MTDEFLRIRIAAYGPRNTDELTVAELGALLTAVNRSVNKLVIGSPEFASVTGGATYNPLSQEPTLIQLRVGRVRQGSVEVQAAIDLLNAVGLDADTAKQLLLGILANALFDPSRTQALVYDFTHALQRISSGAIGKSISVTLSLRQRATRVYGEVFEGEGTKVSIEHNVPDDIQ